MQITYLKDYCESAYLIDSVELDFNLDLTTTVVSSKIYFYRNKNIKQTAALKLSGKNLTLQKILLDGVELSNTDYNIDSEYLVIKADKLANKSFVLEITNTISPDANTSLSGLFRSNALLCTQCEAEGFRAITYYLDRPDVLAKFTTRITADLQQYPKLLSNGNLIEQGELAAGRHFTVWQDPFPKPGYLFALVAGNLEVLEDNFITSSKRDVALKLYVEPGNLPKTAHAMAALKKSMAWDEATYGREYDLDLYMIVAVRDFNMGAMENKGLNIFNDKYVLASARTATDLDYNLIDAVIGHEYFHNWSGNRVTCRDWFQLSLKEGFTVFREHQFAEFVSQSQTALIENVIDLRNRQFAEDAGPLAHAVQPKSYVTINNFYTSTIYEKGAEVIRMLAGMLGWPAFRKGCDLYFDKYDGMAVTIEDFVQCMEQVSKQDLSQFRLWYSEIGTPHVVVQRNYDAENKKYTLEFTSNKKMHIPIALGLLDQSGADLIATRIIELRDRATTVVFDNIAQEPVPSLLRDFSAPVIIKHNLNSRELLLLLQHDSNDFVSWDAAQQYIINLFNNAVTEIPDAFIKVLSIVLQDNTRDYGLRALLISLPSNNYLLENINNVDIDALIQLKTLLRSTIANKLQKILLQVYNDNIITGDYQYNANDVAQRKLKSACLYYLAAVDGSIGIKLVQKQFNNANNMTDKLAALAAINDIDCVAREQLLSAFYQEFKDDPLVVAKWHRLHAATSLPNTHGKITELMQHDSFSINNPNNVYALLGSFSNNLVNFHHSDGSGYNLLQDVVLQLDKSNPQVASRMLECFSNWRKFDSARQTEIRSCVSTINQQAQSQDVLEIVAKILG
ncbi:MAG: aminopeptidase N [Legionellales bacterium]|nr:MAG: aminopeptidase N [Legionellales bacterium]